MPRITQFAAEHDWLALVALPRYAPEINPTEGFWSLIKRARWPTSSRSASMNWQAPSASRSNGIQYRPELVDGCLTETGLVIHPA